MKTRQYRVVFTTGAIDSCRFIPAPNLEEAKRLFAERYPGARLYLIAEDTLNTVVTDTGTTFP